MRSFSQFTSFSISEVSKAVTVHDDGAAPVASPMLRFHCIYCAYRSVAVDGTGPFSGLILGVITIVSAIIVAALGGFIHSIQWNRRRAM